MNSKTNLHLEEDRPPAETVQRLVSDSSYQLQPVLSNFITHDENMLTRRETLLQANLLSTQTSQLRSYKSDLPKQLTNFQRSWCVGLVLSDATLQRNSSKDSPTFRLKIQQNIQHRSLLDATLEILKPWVTGIVEIQNRPMLELVTLSHSAFNELGELFQDKHVELVAKACVTKAITDPFEQYLDPIAIASWFCGDGGRRDYGKNEGKAIQFHTQAFTKECVENLAKALKKRYNWNVQVKLDYDDKYLLQVEASSFESFIDTVRPFILPEFVKRLPKDRS